MSASATPPPPHGGLANTSMAEAAAAGAALLQLPQPLHGGYSNRAAPTEPVYDSYSTNRLCVFTDDGPIWLAADPASAAAPEPGAAAPEPGARGGVDDASTMLIPNRRATVADAMPSPSTGMSPDSATRDECWTYISGWNPDGKPCTLQENQALHAELLEDLRTLGIASLPAVTVAFDGQWFEEGLVMVGVSGDVAHDLAWKYQQAAWLQIGSGWQVNSRFRSPRAVRYAVAHELPQRGPACPVMRWENDLRKCRMVGGPYGSSAMAAAAIWSEHRRIGIALLGCGMCNVQRGSDSPAGPILYLRDIRIASRYGGYSTGGYSNSDWQRHARVVHSPAPHIDAAHNSHQGKDDEQS